MNVFRQDQPIQTHHNDESDIDEMIHDLAQIASMDNVKELSPEEVEELTRNLNQLKKLYKEYKDL